MLSGYPYKRLGRYTQMLERERRKSMPLPTVPTSAQDVPIRIALRGFRRRH